MSARRRRRARGFTLIETVLALAVFAVLMAAVQASLFSGQKLMASVTRRSDPAADMLVVRRVFERWVGALTAPAATVDAAQPILSANRERLTFFASLDEGDRVPVLWAVEMAIVPGPAGPATRLEMRRRRANAPTGIETSVLLDWPMPLAFLFGVGTVDTGLKWSGDVAPGDGVPAQVRLVTARGPLLSTRIVLQENGRCLSLRGTTEAADGGCRLQ